MLRGPGGQAAPTRSRRPEGQHPRPRRNSSSSVLAPDPRLNGKRFEAGDDMRPHEQQQESDAIEDLVDLRRRRTQGRLRGAREGFYFPSGFPPQVEDFGPSHRSVVIEPTVGGHHRQPRHNRGSRPPGWGGHTGSIERSLGLYPSDTSGLATQQQEYTWMDRHDRLIRHLLGRW
jgi:hypothetical protein